MNAVDEFYRRLCDSVAAATDTRSRIEWDHYGSGYASYVDAWFYRPTPGFDVDEPLGNGEEHKGLVVLLSRLSHYFVFMEGSKYWDKEGGSGYMPDFSMLDQLPTPAVAELAAHIQPLLQEAGLVRASRQDLETLLPQGTAVPTILGEEPYRHYDALFHWED